MKSLKRIALALTAIAISLAPAPSLAATVTSGFVSGSVFNDFAANIQMAGDGFTLSGFDPVRGAGIQATSHVPDPWVARPGEAVNLSSRVFGGHPDVLPILTWQGTPYRASVDFLFSSPPVVMTQQTLTVPFTFTGNVTALAGPSISLTGQGITTATYEADLRRIQFDFIGPPPPPAPPAQAPPASPPLALADVAAMHPSLLNLLRDCGMCAEVRDLGTMANGRRGVQLTPVSGGFLSGPIVAELDPGAAGGSGLLVNPEPTSWVLLLTGFVWLVMRRLQERCGKQPNLVQPH